MIRRTRARYWSHSWVAKFTAKWLGAPQHPEFGTMEEWDAFHKNQTANYRLQDIVEETLSKLQNIWMFPSDVYYSIRAYIRNRFVHKLHVLQTGLDKGQYYEYETRLLYGMFESFVQFIEQDQTLENLKWELTLTNRYEWLPEEEAKLQPDYGKPDHQAIAAQEKMALYTWWKVTRPARPDAYEASGFKQWSAENKKEDDSVFSLFVDDSDAAKKETRAELSRKWREIEEQYTQEDEEMMIRLIRIRRTCWT
jgi:hypothetical protein